MARCTAIAAIGIDAEPNAPLPSGVLAAIVATDEERKWATRPASVCRDKLLFSAKEAVFKAWFPLTRRWLGFDEVELSAISDRGTFGIRFLVSEPDAHTDRLNVFEGRWTWTAHLILTAVTVRRVLSHPVTNTPIVHEAGVGRDRRERVGRDRR